MSSVLQPSFPSFMELFVIWAMPYIRRDPISLPGLLQVHHNFSLFSGVSQVLVKHEEYLSHLRNSSSPHSNNMILARLGKKIVSLTSIDAPCLVPWVHQIFLSWNSWSWNSYKQRLCGLRMIQSMWKWSKVWLKYDEWKLWKWNCWSTYLCYQLFYKSYNTHMCHLSLLIKIEQSRHFKLINIVF